MSEVISHIHSPSHSLGAHSGGHTYRYVRLEGVWNSGQNPHGFMSWTAMTERYVCNYKDTLNFPRRRAEKLQKTIKDERSGDNSVEYLLFDHF